MSHTQSKWCSRLAGGFSPGSQTPSVCGPTYRGALDSCPGRPCSDGQSEDCARDRLEHGPCGSQDLPISCCPELGQQLVTLNRSKCGNTAWLCPQEGRGMRILASTGLCHREEPEWPVQSQNHLAVGLQSAPEINTAL